MDMQVKEINFKSIQEELMYEIQDVIEFVSYIFSKKSSANTYLDLVGDYVHRPSNDNWPIYESKSDKTISVNVN